MSQMNPKEFFTTLHTQFDYLTLPVTLFKLLINEGKSIRDLTSWLGVTFMTRVDLELILLWKNIIIYIYLVYRGGVVHRLMMECMVV